MKMFGAGTLGSNVVRDFRTLIFLVTNFAETALDKLFLKLRICQEKIADEYYDDKIIEFSEYQILFDTLYEMVKFGANRRHVMHVLDYFSDEFVKRIENGSIFDNDSEFVIRDFIKECVIKRKIVLKGNEVTLLFSDSSSEYRSAKFKTVVSKHLFVKVLNDIKDNMSIVNSNKRSMFSFLLSSYQISGEALVGVFAKKLGENELANDVSFAKWLRDIGPQFGIQVSVYLNEPFLFCQYFNLRF